MNKAKNNNVILANKNKVLAFVFDVLLFNWVFKIITIIPSIKEQVIGHGIYLGGFSHNHVVIR